MDDIMDGDVLRRGSPTVWKTILDILEAEEKMKKEKEGGERCYDDAKALC